MEHCGTKSLSHGNKARQTKVCVRVCVCRAVESHPFRVDDFGCANNCLLIFFGGFSKDKLHWITLLVYKRISVQRDTL